VSPISSVDPFISMGPFTCLLLCGPFTSSGWPKNWHHFCTPLLYQILADSQHYFTVRIRRKCVIILSVKIPPHLKCVATPLCEMSSVLKATTENKTTCVTTHFNKLTTENNMFIVQSNCHILQFNIKCSMCPPCCWTTHSSQRHH